MWLCVYERVRQLQLKEKKMRQQAGEKTSCNTGTVFNIIGGRNMWEERRSIRREGIKKRGGKYSQRIKKTLKTDKESEYVGEVLVKRV